MLFNINDNVYVKLTEHGRRVHHEEHVRFWKSVGHSSPPEYTPPKEDSEGWSKWQMWELMREFGSHIGMGKCNVFETTIMLRG